jgi:hypothetical protein
MIQFPYQRDERLAPRSVDDLTRASVASLGRVPAFPARLGDTPKQNRHALPFLFGIACLLPIPARFQAP